MQAEFLADDPDTQIHILGINGIGLESANDLAVDGRDIPWLQDVPKQDVWTLWNVTYRDVVILDRGGSSVGVFNLTEHDLSIPAEYEALRQLLLDAAAE